MKYLYSKCIFAFIAAMCFLAFPAKAVEIEKVNLGSVGPDSVIKIPEFKELIADYTPSVSGPVKFIWSTNPLTLYKSAKHEESDIVGGSHSYTQNGQLISYSYLEAGHTYYIYSAMTLMAGELIIREGDTKIELLHCSPSVDPATADYYGGKFSASQNYRIELDFNYPVTVGNCLLMAGGEKERVNPVIGNATVTFDVNDVVMNFYRSGVIKEGDTMTLRVLTIKDALNPDNKYNGNGRLEIDFVMAGKPAELVKTSGFSQKSTENPFNSYYLPDDPNSLMQLEFDKDIDTNVTPLAQITYGNPENIELGVYREDIPGIVDGGKVTFDFSGKLRRRIDMLPGAEDSSLPTAVYVAFTNIYTPDGQRAYTGMLSNPTGFSVSYVVNELLYTIAADFVPARGNALRPGDPMEIWVMNGNKIYFDDICIDYVENGEKKTVCVGKENIVTSVDKFSVTGDDMLFNFTVPQFNADNGSEIDVYMKNLLCADGLDHSADVRGDFVGSTSAVDGIDADDKSVADVFDITGTRVLRSATPAQLSSLNPGLYIYKGRKVLIK